MRILWVKAGKLLPVDTGGKIRSFNLLRQLATRHDVMLLSYYSGARDAAYEAALSSQFESAVTVATGGPTSTASLFLDYLRHLASPVPYAVAKFTAPRVRQFISQWMRECRFDVAVCDFLSASLNFPDRLDTPAALFQHNVESALWRRQADHERNPFKRAAFAVEARKMWRYERAAIQRFHHVIAVSEHDRALMSTMIGDSRVSVAPTGVDLSQYRAASSVTARQPVVMFLGSMDWEPNIDGVEYFCREIWPAIHAAVPEARFRIVGRNPHSRVRRLAGDPTVEVTGDVPVVADHLRDAAVFVVPLRVGGGTRLKIYEAMAAGRAIVSTTTGAEGLDINDGSDILLADNPGKFAADVTMLLRNEAKRRQLGAAASAHAAQFDWPMVVRRFEEALERTIAAAEEPTPLFTRGAA